MTGDHPLTIDLVSDYVCPWCYVGHAGLGFALMALGFERPVTLRYRPYRLSPDTPRGGEDRAAALARKMPDPARRDAMHAALEEAARDAGLAFDPAAPRILPDTTDAHRVTRWAHEEDRQREVADALFAAYWRRGEDLGDRAVLAAAAARGGMDRAETAARLDTDEDAADVAEEAASFRAAGVSGVPTFVVNEAEGFSGALPKAALLDAIRACAPAR